MASGLELLASAIGGGVLTVASQELLRWWRRPVLSIEFINNSAHVSRTTINWPNDFKDPQKGTTEYEAIFLRVKAYNSGRSTARECRAYMTRVLRHNADGSTETIEGQDAIPLNWSMHEDQYRPIDIPPMINQFVDVCFTISRDKPQKLFPTGNFPNRLRKAWDKPGEFQIDVLITADGVKPRSRTVKFEWRGPWDTLRAVS